MYTIPLHVIKWCAQECERQESGEASVYKMADAWDLTKMAFEEKLPIDSTLIQQLLMTVEPEKNKNGFRRTPVIMPDGTVIPWENIERQIEELCKVADTITPEQWYEEFQRIHPGQDGNGRVGAILINYLAGTLDYPAVPPDVFGG